MVAEEEMPQQHGKVLREIGELTDFIFHPFYPKNDVAEKAAFI